MRYKKSQIQEIFIYVLAIIVFSMILLYGYKAIRGLGAKADQIALLQLKTDITSAVKRAIPDYGSVIREELEIPEKFNRVCFVDITKSDIATSQAVCDDTTPDKEPLVCDSWKTNSKENMFLLSKSGDVITYDIGKIKINEPYYTCISVAYKKIVIRIEGKGDYALLSEWTGCKDNRKNNGEEGTDCGGPCDACISDKTICQTADENRNRIPCSALDIACYGYALQPDGTCPIKYKESCCKEYNLCC